MFDDKRAYRWKSTAPRRRYKTHKWLGRGLGQCRHDLPSLISAFCENERSGVGFNPPGNLCRVRFSEQVIFAGQCGK